MTEPIQETSEKPGAKALPVVSLELIRGLASVGVFIHHLVFNLGDFLPVAIRGFGQWGHLMVVIFFVLSGYVIGLSQLRSHRPAGAFLWARLKRIEPLYLVGLAVAIVTALPSDRDNGIKLIGNLFFIQSWNELVVAKYSSNPSLWSLGPEMQFYLLFALMIWCQKIWAKYLWWALAYLSLFLWEGGYRFHGVLGLAEETLSLSLMWLLGNFLVNGGSRYCLNRSQALFLFSFSFLVSRTTWAYVGDYDPWLSLPNAGLAALLIHSFTQAEINKEVVPTLISWMGLILFYLVTILICVITYNHMVFPTRMIPAYALLPGVVLALSHWSGWSKLWQSSYFRQFSLVLGRCSYALYVIHWPMIMFSTYLFKSGWFYLLWTVVATATTVGFLEYVVQPRAVRFMEWGKGLLLQSLGYAKI